MKKILISLILSLALCTATVFGTTYSDVKETDWHYPYISNMTKAGYLTGNPDGTFRPDDYMSLTEFSIMLGNAYYGTTLAMVHLTEFPTWWEPYVYAVYLRDGYNTTVLGDKVEEYKNLGYRFQNWSSYAHEPISRNDAASMLTNLLLDQYLPVATEDETFYILSTISDVDSFTTYGTSIATTYQYGLFYGNHLGLFNGDNYLTRGEAAVLMQALTNLTQVKQERRSDAFGTLGSSAYNMSSYQYTGQLDVENYVFARVNELRAALGLNQLTSNNTLVEYAYTRAQETEVHWAHERPDGSSWSTVISPTDTENFLTGENLTMGTGFQSYEYPDMIFKAWLNSPGHYENMISPTHKELGLAVYVNDQGHYYATQIFGIPAA